MALRTKEEILAELKEIDEMLVELDREVFRLRRMKKGIMEAYGVEEDKPKKYWSRKSKQEAASEESNG